PARDDIAQSWPADRGTDHRPRLHHHVLAGTRLPDAGHGNGVRRAAAPADRAGGAAHEPLVQTGDTAFLRRAGMAGAAAHDGQAGSLVSRLNAALMQPALQGMKVSAEV